jgi:hypothetical protein
VNAMIRLGVLLVGRATAFLQQRSQGALPARAGGRQFLVQRTELCSGAVLD